MTRGHVGDLYWHVHHDQLAEVLNQPIKKRIDYINARKPENERETRLRWMEPVLTLDGPAVVDLYLAWTNCDRAMADYRRARVDYDRVGGARAALDRARGDYERAWDDFRRAEADYDRAWAALEPLHALEHPGCPWDGRTLVFPEVTP